MTTSTNGAIVIGPGGSITDLKGNVYTISAAGQVVENGRVDRLTNHVTELAFKGGEVWQENTSFLWYAKVGNVPGSYDGWSPGTYNAPVPVSRTWVGGGNNSAGNPNDWNDHGVPKPGDTLNMASGTIHLTGNQLQGDPLQVPLGGSVTVDTTGVTALQLDVGSYGPSAYATVNLAAGSVWVGGFNNALYSTTTIAGKGTFDNVVTSEVGGSAIIDTNVVGVGVIEAAAGHGPGHIEFAHGVAAGQTVGIENGYGFRGGFVQVDAPSLYHAKTDLSMGQLVLEGLKASSYSYDGSTLKLFGGGGKMIDSLGMRTSDPAYGGSPGSKLAVAQLAGGIDIFKSVNTPVGGVLLALHA
jgi:hypothetical protein